jgi:hypothetical protein
MDRAQSLKVDAIMVKPKATLEEIGRTIQELLAERHGFPPNMRDDTENSGYPHA